MLEQGRYARVTTRLPSSSLETLYAQATTPDEKKTV